MKDLFLLIHGMIIKMEIIYKLDYINNAIVTIDIHDYYGQLLNKIIKRINKIPIKYDLYISQHQKKKNSL